MELADDDSPVELGINAPATPEGDPASQALRRSLEEPSRTPRFADTLATEALTSPGIKALARRFLLAAAGHHHEGSRPYERRRKRTGSREQPASA